MVEVQVWGSLRKWTGDQARIEVEACNIQELLERLGKMHPGLKPQIERGVSVSVDGTIYRDSCLEPIGKQSEVILLPYMAGG